jgi:hypothetical protein
MRNDTGDNVTIASSMTAATNYRNSDSRPMSGKSIFIFFKHHVLSHQHLQDSLVEFQDSISPTIIIIIIYNYYYHHHYHKSYKHIYGYQICII